MAMSNCERYQVIQQLMQKFPYPEKFYDRLYDDQLLAMLYKQPSTNKKKKAKNPPINIDEGMSNEQSKCKVVNGVTYVLTDGGFWEEEQD